MLSELKEIQQNVDNKKRELTDLVDKLESDRRGRAEKRKETLLSQMKKVLAELNEKDKKTVADLKVNVFDKICSLNKISNELSANLEAVQNRNELITMKATTDMKKKIEELDLVNLSKHLCLSVTTNVDQMNFSLVKMIDSILLSSPLMSADQFQLKFPEKTPGGQEEPPSSSYYEFIIILTSGQILSRTMLSMMVVEVRGLVVGTKNKMENFSLIEKLQKGGATVDPSGTSVSVRMRRPNNLMVSLSVLVLGSNIGGSPLIHQFCHDEALDPSQHNMTVANETLAGIQLSDLDQTVDHSYSTTSLQMVPQSPGLDPIRELTDEDCTYRDLQENIWDLGIDGKSAAIAVTLPLVPSDDDVDLRDPHFMLNASKAPTGKSLLAGWGSPDWSSGNDSDYSTREIAANTSLMPASCWTSLNQSVWEEVSGQADPNLLNLRDSSSLKLIKHYVPQALSNSKSRGIKYCLTDPDSIAFLPQANKFLVTEGKHNRVGVYSASDCSFNAWLAHPKGGHGFNHPTSIVCLANNFVVIVEEGQILILNQEVSSQQIIPGKFLGLAEGEDNRIYTLIETEARQFTVRVFVPGKCGKKYIPMEDIDVKVAQEFENWHTRSNCRFLAVFGSNIFVTDEGMHKFYILDMDTAGQIAHGYLGNKEGQLKGPRGILADDVGNLLVADSENNRVVLYSGDGRFLKTLVVPDSRLLMTHSVVRYKKGIFVTYKGNGGGVVWYDGQSGHVEMENIRPLE